MYRPEALMEPAPTGFSVHETAEFVEFATFAVNCCVCAGVSATMPGVRLTCTVGARVTEAESDFETPPNTVAVIEIVC